MNQAAYYSSGTNERVRRHKFKPEQLAGKITVESVAAQADRSSWAATSQGSYGAHNFP